MSSASHNGSYGCGYNYNYDYSYNYNYSYSYNRGRARRRVLVLRRGRKNGTDLVVDKLDSEIIARFVDSNRGKELSRKKYCNGIGEFLREMVRIQKPSEKLDNNCDVTIGSSNKSNSNSNSNSNNSNSNNSNSSNSNSNSNRSNSNSNSNHEDEDEYPSSNEHRIFALRVPRHADLSVADGLLDLDCLSELDLWDPLEIPAWIGGFRALRVLKLQYRTHALARGLPEEIGNGNLAESLVKLDLDSSTVRSLPGSIGRLRQLKSLVLSSTTELLRLPDEIGNLVELTQLNLNSSAIESLPRSIGNLRKLECLDLSSTARLHALPEEIGNLRSLVRWYLVCTAIRSLPRSVGNLQNLELLDLYFADELSELPDAVGNLKRLVSLDLGNNSSLRSIPSSIGTLKRLKKMALDGTPCTELLEKGLPPDPSLWRTARECRSLGCMGISLYEQRKPEAVVHPEWAKLSLQLANNRARSRVMYAGEDNDENENENGSDSDSDNGSDNGSDSDNGNGSLVDDCGSTPPAEDRKTRTIRSRTGSMRVNDGMSVAPLRLRTIPRSLWPLILCNATKAFGKYRTSSRYEDHCKYCCSCKKVGFAQPDAIFQLLIHHRGAESVLFGGGGGGRDVTWNRNATKLSGNEVMGLSMKF